MNQSVKLSVLASVLAAAALAAGCVPSLNYGSVPPEPKYTTKLTTTTATSATKKPFTTHKLRTGTISWEELNGPQEYTTRASATYIASSSAGYLAGEWVTKVISRDTDDSGNAGGEDSSPQTTAWEDEPPQTAAPEPPPTEPPVTEPPQTEPPDVFVPPQEEQAPPQEPAPEPPPQEPENFGE